jgi:CRP-like cAMP-binding protein
MMKTALDEQAQSGLLLRKLGRIDDLTYDEKRAVLNLPMKVKVFDADVDIVRDGDRPSDCALVLSGFVCRYKILPDGKRQILGLYIPGDMPDLQSFPLQVPDYGVGTLVRSNVGLIPHECLQDMLRNYPNLTRTFWRETLIDAAIAREWMIGLGRRSAYQRTAHLLCELHLRMMVVGLAKGDGYDLPLTQNELGDTLGLSTVHVNRVLQDLRREGLITLRGSALRIPDTRALQAAGEFDPAYLHLRR